MVFLTSAEQLCLIRQGVFDSEVYCLMFVVVDSELWSRISFGGCISIPFHNTALSTCTMNSSLLRIVEKCKWSTDSVVGFRRIAWSVLGFVLLALSLSSVYFENQEMAKDSFIRSVFRTYRAGTTSSYPADVVPPSTPTSRNFLTDPVTSHEDMILRANKISNITAAVCHPTLFGNLTLARILSFASYYRLLGFDHLFFWYEAESLPWTASELQLLGNLSYVTVTRFPDSQTLNYHGQNEVQRACRKDPQYGASYDWLLVVDADEYLWLGPDLSTVQDFVLQHPSITYFSFGKWMYSTTLTSSLQANESSRFGVDIFPFTLGRYCYRGPSRKSCPDWQGRSKVLVMPSHYPNDIGVHGDEILMHSRAHEAIHYDHHLAHVKEWRGFPEPGIGVSPTVHEPSSFAVSADAHLGIVFQQESFPLLPNGTLLLMYDKDLREWFQRVESNLPT